MPYSFNEVKANFITFALSSDCMVIKHKPRAKGFEIKMKNSKGRYVTGEEVFNHLCAQFEETTGIKPDWKYFKYVIEPKSIFLMASR